MFTRRYRRTWLSWSWIWPFCCRISIQGKKALDVSTHDFAEIFDL